VFQSLLMSEGRVLALDYGTKHIGVACCDEMRVTVQPLPSFARRGMPDLLERLRSLVDENRIQAIVVGMPLNMDGTAGDSVRRVERFMESLRNQLQLPLHSVDERLSTMEALEIWRGMSRRQQQKYRTVDSLAAALILKRFLEDG
jgi:putative holliday junction resolvase